MLDELRTKVAGYAPGSDFGLVERAYLYARTAHEGQYRVSGEPYINHPVAVATILAELELDTATLAAGLLHDVVEDTGRTLADLEKEFGAEVALMVDGVTKLSHLEMRSREEEQVENLRKMFVAVARDLRVIYIRLADRLHNMRTLEFLPPDRQVDIAQETLEILAPLAHRLGVFRWVMELEDLSLRYLEPEKYMLLRQLVAKKREEREEFTQQVIGAMREALDRHSIKADIQGRAKHFYSIYRKMFVQGREFNEIYDLIAIRIIVDNIRECYSALGVVHSLWKPIPGRFKDFIAMPKPNMYQSLHTTVIGHEGGEPFEIQIRTWDMHRTAEYGVAAHWKYKEGITGGPGGGGGGGGGAGAGAGGSGGGGAGGGGSASERSFEEKLSWLRRILEVQRDSPDDHQFLEALKLDFFADEVFVFTPKGDVIDLPAGATPLDFAYRVHTDVGHRCIGAKVNGRIATLDYRLQTGDIVEILTSRQSSGPSSDWLDIVTTSSAKSKIRQWFKVQRREEFQERGKDLLEKEARRQGFEPPDLLDPQWLADLGKKHNWATAADLFSAVGDGTVTPQYIVNKLREEYNRVHKVLAEIDLERINEEAKAKARRSAPAVGVHVEGVENPLIRFARCCSPIPGDPIVGYITRGRGLTVHRRTCPNVVHLDPKDPRIIEVSWEGGEGGVYPVTLEISSLDRPALLSEVINAISDTRTNMHSVNAVTHKDRTATITLVLEIRNLEQLRYIISKIARVRDVLAVNRVAPEQGRAGQGRAQG